MRTYDRGQLTALEDTTGFYLTRLGNGSIQQEPGNRTGVSVEKLISDFGLVPDDVDSLTATVSNGTRVLLGSLHDFDPTSPLYPFDNEFARGLPPIFAPNPNDSAGIEFDIPPRDPRSSDPTVGDGYQASATAGQSLPVVLKVRTTLLSASATASPSDGGVAHQLITFTGTAQQFGGGAPTWTWTFPDGTPTAEGSIVRHAFDAAGDYDVYADVVGSNNSSARLTVHVVVGGGSPPPTTTTPPPGPGHGRGSSTAPNRGPVVGTGPRVGGVPTDRPGNGRAGSTFASQPPVASVTAGATGDGPRVDGQVVGYLLGDAASAVQLNPQAAKNARDDSAPAARDGRTVSHLLGWLTATVCLAALLVLGAGSERRRPSRRPKRS